MLLIRPVFAQSWYTVDDFQLSSGNTAYATALARDPTGTIIYSAGDADDAAHVHHHLVFESADSGTNWSVSDDYTGAADSIRAGGYPNIACDPAGNLYASGGGNATNGQAAWFVRGLPAGGSTWVTLDLLLTTNAAPNGLATDPAGNVYVVGWQGGVWLVRKGTPTNTGIFWANVDAFTSPYGNCTASGVFCHPTAGVFVVGSRPVTTSSGLQTGWTVRRSQNGGASWSIVDTFLLPSQQGYGASCAQGVGTDAVGNLYVVGYASQRYESYLPDHWIVRKSVNPASSAPSWTTVDNFQLAAKFNSSAASLALDTNGNLFVTGQAANSGGWQWVTRESVGGTGTWNTVDTFHYGTGLSVYAALGDGLGNVFVAGEGIPASGGFWHWLVRKN